MSAKRVLNYMFSLSRCLGTCLVVVCLAVPLAAEAYNFTNIRSTGEPTKWDNSETIQYWLDPGPLGRLTNEQVQTLLKEAMKVWENASPNANPPKFEFAGYLPEDINGTNYQDYVTKNSCSTQNLSGCDTEAQKNLQTVILLDEDGSIITNSKVCLGGCAATAGPRVFDGPVSDSQYIKQGIMIVGEFAGNSEAKINYVVGIMVHELGHLLGLAHSSVNQQIYIEGPEEDLNLLPTMFFFQESAAQNTATLKPDDIVAISYLYPSAQFSSETSEIQGQIRKSDGSPMQHVNIIARETDDPLCEAVSYLHGRSCDVLAESECENYLISGLEPGSYTVETEEVADDSLGLTLAPSLIPSEDIAGDAEFWNDGDQANEEHLLSSTIALTGGESKDNVDIVLNRSEITPDRIQYLPLSTFTPGPNTRCPEKPVVDYAALIGIDEIEEGPPVPPPPAASSGGCNLIR